MSTLEAQRMSEPAAASADPASLYAPHREGDRFFNPWRRMSVTLADVVRWKLTSGRSRRRSPPDVPMVANDGRSLASPADGVAVTWIGHCTFAIQDGPELFVTDPHWSARALVPRRARPPGVPLAAVPDHAVCLLSHNHYDHLDAATVARLADRDWVVPLGHAAWLRRRGVRRVEELDWWQSVRRGRWTLTLVPAQHWSNRIDMPRNAALWGGWLLDSGERRIFFAGDSGYFHLYPELGRRFGPIDVALMPIGAYEPRWFMRYQHMNPEDAWRAFGELGARQMVAMHWGTFDLTDEPVDEAPRALVKVLAAAAAAGADTSRVHVPAVGERLELG